MLYKYKFISLNKDQQKSQVAGYINGKNMYDVCTKIPFNYLNVVSIYIAEIEENYINITYNKYMEDFMTYEYRITYYTKDNIYAEANGIINAIDLEEALYKIEHNYPTARSIFVSLIDDDE